MKQETEAFPLVYSCSGCSGAGQLANRLALTMDHLGMAEMSCIAGVGGNVKKLVRTACSGRPIIAIDGCPLSCAKSCLANHHIIPTHHIRLDTLGVPKNANEDWLTHETEIRMLGIVTDIVYKNESSTRTDSDHQESYSTITVTA